MKKINSSLFFAWLTASTESQRWEITKEIFKVIEPTDLVLFNEQYSRTRFGETELILRRFWIRVAYCLPIWKRFSLWRLKWGKAMISRIRVGMFLQRQRQAGTGRNTPNPLF